MLFLPKGIIYPNIYLSRGGIIPVETMAERKFLSMPPDFDPDFLRDGVNSGRFKIESSPLNSQELRKLEFLKYEREQHGLFTSEVDTRSVEPLPTELQPPPLIPSWLLHDLAKHRSDIPPNPPPPAKDIFVLHPASRSSHRPDSPSHPHHPVKDILHKLFHK